MAAPTAAANPSGSLDPSKYQDTSDLRAKLTSAGLSPEHIEASVTAFVDVPDVASAAILDIKNNSKASIQLVGSLVSAGLMASGIGAAGGAVVAAAIPLVTALGQALGLFADTIVTYTYTVPFGSSAETCRYGFSANIPYGPDDPSWAKIDGDWPAPIHGVFNKGAALPFKIETKNGIITIGGVPWSASVLRSDPRSMNYAGHAGGWKPTRAFYKNPQDHAGGLSGTSNENSMSASAFKIFDTMWPEWMAIQCDMWDLAHYPTGKGAPKEFGKFAKMPPAARQFLGVFYSTWLLNAERELNGHRPAAPDALLYAVIEAWNRVHDVGTPYTFQPRDESVIDDEIRCWTRCSYPELMLAGFYDKQRRPPVSLNTGSEHAQGKAAAARGAAAAAAHRASGVTISAPSIPAHAQAAVSALSAHAPLPLVGSHLPGSIPAARTLDVSIGGKPVVAASSSSLPAWALGAGGAALVYALLRGKS